MKASFWQNGNAMDYKNETGSIIEANSVVIIGSRIGVAGGDIQVGAVGTLHLVGVWKLPKVALEEIELGAEVYLKDTEVTKIATGAIKAGYAFKTASSSDTTVLVKLLG